jgi:hypothetical protein
VDEIITLILRQAHAASYIHGNNSSNITTNYTTTTQQSSWNTTTVSLSTLDRAALTGIYVATELHLLTDTSEHYQDTWNFLRAKVKDWYSFRHSTTRPSNSNSIPNVSTSDTVVATMAVASSLAGGLLSLAPPLARAFVQTAVPNLLVSTLPGIISSTLQGTSVSYSGRKPLDYSDLPPFPVEERSDRNDGEKNVTS